MKRNKDLARDRDSLHQGMKMLSDQLKTRADSADSQQAKLLQEVEKLSQQQSEQQQQLHQAAAPNASMAQSSAQAEAAEDGDGEATHRNPGLPGTEQQSADLAQAEAASARNEMHAHIRCLADGPASTRRTNLASTLPQIAGWVLTRESLAADIANLHAQFCLYRCILEEAQAHEGLPHAIHHVSDLVLSHPPSIPRVTTAEIELLIWSQRALHKMPSTIQGLQDSRRSLTQEVQQIKDDLRRGYEVVVKFSSSMDSTRSRPDLLELRERFFQAFLMMSRVGESSVADAARLETAVCKIITAYCASELAVEELPCQTTISFGQLSRSVAPSARSKNA